MNPYFSLETWRDGFPRRSYARLDDIEPVAPTGEDPLTFTFDAVDAGWRGFGSDGLFNPGSDTSMMFAETYWKHRFDGKGRDDPDPFDEIPLYRVEISRFPWEELYDDFPRTEEPWITLTLTDRDTGTPATVYGGLFAPPVNAFVEAVAEAPAPSSLLSALFDMEKWPDATNDDIVQALAGRCALAAMACFDIGQGLASALLCPCGYPVYYFDVGCGSGRNAPTSPPQVDFCTCDSPPVILSHWDTDHWAGARRQPALLGLTWIVPRQTISTSHALIGSDILKAGGRLLVVANGAPPLTWGTPGQTLDLRRCSGPGRNHSGLALVVTNNANKATWVLTGDAGYNFITHHPPPATIAAMVAPHHGADMGPKSTPFMRSGQSYARLLYSFGPGNNHGPKKPPVQHPTPAATLAHTSRNWGHGAWPAATPASCVAGADVLATAEHPGSHLGGVGVTWNGSNAALGHLASCPHVMPISQW